MSPSRKFVASGLFGIALGFAVLALASYMTVHAEYQRREAGAWLRQTLKVRSDLYQLYGLLQAAESGQRGFIITQDERYLDASSEATRKLPAVVDRLSERVRDNPKQLEIVAEMRYDEVSARYAEFGPFVTGLVLDPATVLDRSGLPMGATT